HTTCGGRPLNDDIVDILYTLVVGGLDGPRISDGVDQATQPATRSFPYLCSPNPEPPDLMSVLGAAATPPEAGAPSPARPARPRRPPAASLPCAVPIRSRRT